MRFLIGCHNLVASGGLLRFERVGAALRQMGHEAAYAVRDERREFDSAHPVLSFEAAGAQEWDAVLIPGTGFPEDTIQAFERFRTRQFGLRVQMILNGPHLRSQFLTVNKAIAPQMVVFNNEHWPAGGDRALQARQFHKLVGAVDTNLFRPAAAPERRGNRFIIGAQAAKNPEALLEALPILPPDCALRFFGFDRTNAIARHGTDPRVSQTGPLFGPALAAYYRGIDVMVSAEAHAGWANVAAEAMASGAPVITTRAGTLSIASHEETALIIDSPTPQAIAESVERLRHDASLRSALIARARTRILRFDWRDYTRKLVELVRGLRD